MQPRTQPARSSPSSATAPPTAALQPFDRGVHAEQKHLMKITEPHRWNMEYERQVLLAKLQHEVKKKVAGEM